MSRLHECLETLLNKYNIPVRNLGQPNVNAYAKSIVQQLQSISAAMSRDEREQYFQEMLEIRNSITDENWSALHALRFPNGEIPTDFYNQNPRYIAEKAGLIHKAGNPGGMLNSLLGPYMANEYNFPQHQSFYAQNADMRHKLLEMYDCLLSIVERLYPTDFRRAQIKIALRASPASNNASNQPDPQIPTRPPESKNPAQEAVAEIKTGDQVAPPQLFKFSMNNSRYTSGHNSIFGGPRFTQGAEIKSGDQAEEDKQLDGANGGRKMKTNKHKHKKGKNKKTNKRKKYNKIKKSRRTKK